MKTLLLSLFVLAAVPGLAQPQTVADIPFDSSADFLKLPAGTNFGGGGDGGGGVSLTTGLGGSGTNFIGLGDGTGGNGIHPYVFRSQIVGEIAHGGFERSFRDTHDIIVLDYASGTKVSQRSYRTTVDHKWRDRARYGHERVSTYFLR